MPITFPSSPATNDVYSSGGKSWQWTGSTWDALGTTVITPVRNQLINGAFDFWQRGTTFSVIGGYTADRWYSDTSHITSRSTDVPAGQPFNYSIKFTNAPANAALRQAIELPVAGSQCDFYDGTTWTASFWVKLSAGTRNIGFYAAFTTGIGTQQRQVFLDTSSKTATTSWQRVSYTFTIAPGAAVTSSTCLQITPFTVGTGVGVDVFFTGVQFEPGAVATAFTRNGSSLQDELAGCQRYYQRWVGTGGGFIGIGFSDGNTYIRRCQVPTPVTMRATPTISKSGSNVAFYTGNLTSYSGILGFENCVATTGNISFDVRMSSSPATNVGAHFALNGTSADIFEASAEL